MRPPSSTTAAALAIAGLLWTSPATAGVFDDVPEAADYTLLYTLDIPDNADFNLGGVPYTDDLSARFGGTFDRVAYYLELQREGEPRRFVYVSGLAFTTEPARLGVPHLGTGAVFQRPLLDMTVASNAEGIVTGQGLTGGYLEFWGSNYSPANGAHVPGASHDVFDAGDTVLREGGYGSMQIHNIDARQTLLAYNNWGQSGASFSDLGIGDNAQPDPNGLVHPDWTFRGNAPDYALKRLQVLVRPGPTPEGLALQLLEPTPCQVVQRRRGDIADLRIQGRLFGAVDRVEARVVPLMGGLETDWEAIDEAPSGSSFSASLRMASGWYRLEVRGLHGDEVVDTLGVEPVGIGEVFITAGQSNAANAGDPRLTPQDPRVCARTEEGWRVAADPQPIADGSGGSPWPPLGDLLAHRFGVPIGFVSVAVGGTSVDQWRPASADGLYRRLIFALYAVGPHGARAVLWHQGESDALAGTSAESYLKQLGEVIRTARAEVGWEIPWGVARVAFVPDLPQALQEQVRQGQDMVIEQVPGVFEGPLTDDLIGPAWRHDGIHFNARGLREHAARWDTAIGLDPCDGFEDPQSAATCDEPPPDMASGAPDPVDAGLGDRCPEPSPTPDADSRDHGTPSDALPSPAAGSRATGCGCVSVASQDPIHPGWLWALGLAGLAMRRRRALA